MIAKAKGRYMRVSSTKVREVIDLIRGKNVHAASTVLLHTNKGCTKSVTKILNSAVSNAKEKGLAEDQLFISKVFADQGPASKRWRAAAFGRATRILKKTTHLTIELDLITK
jgi:large subunit ribosomal protein L22